MRVGTLLKARIDAPLGANLSRGAVVRYLGNDSVRDAAGGIWLTLPVDDSSSYGGEVFSDHFRVIRRKAKKGGK